jgi:hypothetical protein
MLSVGMHLFGYPYKGPAVQRGTVLVKDQTVFLAQVAIWWNN